MEKYSLRAQIAIFAFLAAAAYGVFYYLFYTGMQQQIESKTQQRSSLRDEVDRGKLTAARLPEFRRQVETREAKLQTLSRILPSSKEVDDLLRKVQQLAAESSLNVLRFKPEATQPRDFYAEWPITLELDGSYHNLAYFFDRLSHLSRIVNVSNLRITANRDPTPSSTINASCTATTFVFIETPEESESAAAGTVS
ncbi:MAG: type 4a pilus biogenesis protein PilO [Acidobacteriota bacterium]